MTTSITETRADGVAISETDVVMMAAALWLASAAGHYFDQLASMPLAVVMVVVVAVAASVAGVTAWIVGRRRAIVIVLIGGLVGFGTGVRAERGYEPVRPAVVNSSADVVTDPIRRSGGTWVVLRLSDGTRVEAGAFGPMGHRLSRLAFGDAVSVSGTVRPFDGRAWLKSRHIEGAMTVETLEKTSGPAWFVAPAAEVRRLIVDGSQYLPRELRPLYTGLVTGDDRAQGSGRRAVFRAAGLGHLVAVSGQNVAFVLAVAGPLTRSLPRRLRLPFILMVLLLFLLVTRMEPSVLRAVTCAGISTWAALTGRERSGLSVLAVACIGLLVADPFLAVVVGFQLSVVASLGILSVTPLLIDRLPGPAYVVQPLAVTLGAQIAVSPLLVVYFGAIPLVTLPANLVVGWAAGVVMMLGLTAGILAGLLTRVGSDSMGATLVVAEPHPLHDVSAWARRFGSLLADWLQLPSEILLRWIDWSATQAVFVPLPVIGLSVALVGCALGVAWFVRPRAGWMLRTVEVLTLGFALSIAVMATPSAPDSPSELRSGCLWLPDVKTLIVRPPCGSDLAEAVISARIRSVDLVVVTGGGRPVEAVAALREVADARLVVAPPLHNVVDARRVEGPLDLRLPSCMLTASDGDVRCGQIVLQLRPSSDRENLSVEVCSATLGESPVVDCRHQALQEVDG